jgi:hypothetical protein
MNMRCQKDPASWLAEQPCLAACMAFLSIQVLPPLQQRQGQLPLPPPAGQLVRWQGARQTWHR